MTRTLPDEFTVLMAREADDGIALTSERLAATDLPDGEVTIAKVNVDEERNLGAMFQIMSIPNVLIFNHGEKVDEFVGLRSKDDIVAQVKKQL